VSSDEIFRCDAGRIGDGMLMNAQLMGFVPTRDPAVARAFYEHVLGLKFLYEDGFATTLETNGIRVRLTKIENHKPLPFTILGWEIPDVEKAVSDLESRGVAFEKYGMPNQDARGIWSSPSGAKIAWFKDPDGNVLSLAQLG
jgi:catechol 2,3-dioxygenase-like lactoylglutathione lyase family enzyme